MRSVYTNENIMRSLAENIVKGYPPPHCAGTVLVYIYIYSVRLFSEPNKLRELREPILAFYFLINGYKWWWHKCNKSELHVALYKWKGQLRNFKCLPKKVPAHVSLNWYIIYPFSKPSNCHTQKPSRHLHFHGCHIYLYSKSMYVISYWLIAFCLWKHTWISKNKKE